MPPGYAAAVEAAGNYHSGDDYIVEFLGYRFSFNSVDFEERVTAAAVRLGLVSDPELARAPVPAMTVPRRYAVVLPAYLAALLALDTHVSLHGQLALGALTFAVLGVALRPLAPLVRAQAVGVVLFATVGEVTGSLVWGVYHYRLHNLPLFIPPAHGLVYLSGIALSRSLRARAVVWAAAVGATAWGIAGLTVLPRLDLAGAFGVPLPLVFLWRSHARAADAGVFLAVAALELYGTSIGTWRWASTLPGLGIPDGNPTSGFSTLLASANDAIAWCSRSTNASCGNSAFGVQRSGTGLTLAPRMTAPAFDLDKPYASAHADSLERPHH